MNEGLIFIAILSATILWGILGALLIVPVMASFSIIMEYLRRRILGMQPFSKDEETQFKVPVEKLQKHQPKIVSKKKAKK